MRLTILILVAILFEHLGIKYSLSDSIGLSLAVFLVGIQDFKEIFK